MRKITKVNPAKSVSRVPNGGDCLQAIELIDAIEKVRPVIDEDGEWSCAEELFARSDLSKEELSELMSYEPVLAGRIYDLYLCDFVNRAALYISDWRECRKGGGK
jgi:hypothetical protein